MNSLSYNGKKKLNSKRIKAITIRVPNGIFVSIPLVDEKINLQESTLNELKQIDEMIRESDEPPRDTSEAIPNSNEFCFDLNFDDIFPNIDTDSPFDPNGEQALLNSFTNF